MLGQTRGAVGGCRVGRRRVVEGWRNGRRFRRWVPWVSVCQALRLEAWFCSGLAVGRIGHVRSTVVNDLQFGGQTFWMMDGQRFGSMMALLVTWSCDRVVVAWWLLITDGLQVWIGSEKGNFKRVFVVSLMVWYRVGGLSTLECFQLAFCLLGSQLVYLFLC